MTIAGRLNAPVLATVVPFGAGLAVMAICALALAQDNRPRGSTVEDPSRERSIELHEVMLNIVELPSLTFTSALHRVKDKGVTSQEIVLGGGATKVWVDHSREVLFDRNVTDSIVEWENAKEFARGIAEQMAGDYRIDRRWRVRRDERGGWIFGLQNRERRGSCFLARVGFLSDLARLGNPDDVRFDTDVVYLDCSGERSLETVMRWLEGMRIVAPF